MGGAGTDVLTVDELSVSFADQSGTHLALDRVNLRCVEGERLGIVGESGCGKSTLARAALGLLPPGAQVLGGSVRVGAASILELSEEERTRLRGTDVAMVFQDPMSALNPVYTVGAQLEEALNAGPASARAKRSEVIDLLRQVGVPDARRRVDDFPHRFSGGLRQRITLAMALARNPRLLVADEPTTALDVTVQAQILELLYELVADRNMALVLITHDLGVVARVCERIAVMYAGQVVEEGPSEAVLGVPSHPYTRRLFEAAPRLDEAPGTVLRTIPGSVGSARQAPGCRYAPRCWLYGDRPACLGPTPGVSFDRTESHRTGCHFPQEAATSGANEAMAVVPVEGVNEAEKTVVSVEAISKHYRVRQGLFSRRSHRIQAVDDVSLQVSRGEVLGLVGESGCGKSTLARLLSLFERPDKGRIVLAGQDAATAGRSALRTMRRGVQLVFQDPYSSLNPRMKVEAIVTEPLRAHRIGDRAERRARAAQLMEMVGLSESSLRRRPTEFSGGERQRIAIARALALDPELLVLDEAVSSLDVSIQAQVLNVLREIVGGTKTAALFITHDLAVAKNLCHRVAVMYIGRIVETGPVDELFAKPLHPYTRLLLDSAIDVGTSGISDRGEPADPAAIPMGCGFHPRCPRCTSICVDEQPTLTAKLPGHAAACHHPVMSDRDAQAFGLPRAGSRDDE